MARKSASRAKPRRFNLALQGGGSHGAFTWGVLDRILEDERLEIAAISGASAGAMNAVVLADGWVKGGREGARKALAQFWSRVGTAAKGSPVQRGPLGKWFNDWSLDASPAYIYFDMLTRLVSPYDLNPANINPLRDILIDQVDFEAVRACDQIGVHISATNVETGRVEVFDRHELRPDHVLASACLPTLFQAVEIEGVPYWDGGYMGNPPLFPLFDHSDSDDVIIVQINPIERAGAPRKARDILNRLNEITFNASLLRELRAIDFVTRLLDAGRLEETGYRRVLVHMISHEQTLCGFGASSKLNAEGAFLKLLFERGREVADTWLDKHQKDIGKRSSVNLRDLFEGGDDPLGTHRLRQPSAFQTKSRRAATE
ncbi:MAG: patatin-like phospholipase family protein [Pseudomonadota bacterium]